MEENKHRDEIKIKFSVDTQELDEAAEKANRLVQLLKEAETLIHSLSGSDQPSLEYPRRGYQAIGTTRKRIP